MKTILGMGILLLMLTAGRAQTNGLTGLLQQGLFEEQANRNLEAAIADYQNLAAQFDKDRQLAATAVFRLGECYRAQGRTNEAATQYERIIHEFSDQQTLATLSRQDLAGMGLAGAGPAAAEKPAAANPDTELWKKLKDMPKDKLLAVLPTLVPDATLNALLQQRNDVQARLAELRSDYSISNIAYIQQKKTMLDELNRQTDEKVNGMMQALELRAQLPGLNLAAAPGLDNTPAAATDEDREIQRIQEMIQNSPDLINAAPVNGFTPLNNAARSGQLKVAQFLLDHGADVNLAPNAGGWSPLHFAAGAGNRAMVELLLKHGADINARTDDQETPLYVAVNNGYQAVTEALLNNKPGVDLPDKSGKTPLDVAAGAGRLKLVQTLLAAGAQAGAESNARRTPLSFAAEGGSLDVITALLAAGAEPNAGIVDEPLLYAIFQKNEAAVELLLKAGANPNVAGYVDFTHDYYLVGQGTHLAPLWLAVRLRDFPIVELLLKFKADPNAIHANGDPVLFSALENTNLLEALLEAGANANASASDDSTALGRAVKEKNLPAAQLLLKFKADPNNPHNGKYSLLFSALSETNILEALLDAGAKVDTITDVEANGTLLANAVGDNNIAATEILLQHGANPNTHNRNGATTLHSAASRVVSPQIVELLLAHKADPNVRNNTGQTPLDILKAVLQDRNSWPDTFNSYEAKAAQVEKLIALLHQHGALDELPDWNAITVSRPAAKVEFAPFHKGTNDWNQFTLLEALANVYFSSQTYSVSQGNNTWAGYQVNSMLPFPDLAHVTIVRPSHDSTNETRIVVNLLNNTNGIDCSKDVPLEFGDVVEIPERDHALGDNATGLADAQRSALDGYVKGTVRLVVRDQHIEIPIYRLNGQASLDGVLKNPEAQKLLLASSDLSRVKVIRHDAKTDERHEWIFDCSGQQSGNMSPGLPLVDYQWNFDGNNPPPPPNAFWLRDGDVIEVPEKP